MTKAERIRIFKAALKAEGFAPKTNREGHLVFKFEGLPYVIELEDRDEMFLRLAFKDFWMFDKASGHLGALIGALHATAETKVAKVSVRNGEVTASVELFLGSPEHFRPVILRSLGALKSAVNHFMEFPPENFTSIF